MELSCILTVTVGLPAFGNTQENHTFKAAGLTVYRLHQKNRQNIMGSYHCYEEKQIRIRGEKEGDVGGAL